MLMRILADNPGKSFTRNLDSKFVSTVKELLRDGRDMSVQQILRETLDNFEANKAHDVTLTALREMWKKEKTKTTKGGQIRTTAVCTGCPKDQRWAVTDNSSATVSAISSFAATSQLSKYELLRSRSPASRSTSPSRTSPASRRSENVCQTSLTSRTINTASGSSK